MLHRHANSQRNGRTGPDRAADRLARTQQEAQHAVRDHGRHRPGQPALYGGRPGGRQRRQQPAQCAPSEQSQQGDRLQDRGGRQERGAELAGLGRRGQGADQCRNVDADAHAQKRAQVASVRDQRGRQLGR